MNENINLCKILKGHEGKQFYSIWFGPVTLKEVTDEGFIINDYDYIIPPNGIPNNGGELSFFPSKDQRDWNKWDKENNHKTPKTWNELIKIKDIFTECAEICSNGGEDKSKTFMNTPIEKAALALLKIHQLIEVGYGGRPTTDKLMDVNNTLCDIDINREGKFEASLYGLPTNLIAFHTKEQAKEFLSYPENVQLLKDYFMIN